MYEAQLLRLLKDPKTRALTDDFAFQWLRLKKVAEARPSTEVLPDPSRRSSAQAMVEEVTLVFDHLRTTDGSVLDLIDGRTTFVNADLAAHYGLNDAAKEFHKVELADANRGGLLGMGAVLAMTSHTNRTSPTLRGKYVLDVLLGTPPPPPPAGRGQHRRVEGEGEGREELPGAAGPARGPVRLRRLPRQDRPARLRAGGLRRRRPLPRTRPRPRRHRQAAHGRNLHRRGGNSRPS